MPASHIDRCNPVPHFYVPPDVRTWRTCKLCGRGANHSIHRTETHPLDLDVGYPAPNGGQAES